MKNMSQVELPIATSTRPHVLSGWRGATIMTVVTALCAQMSFQNPSTPIPVTMQVFAVLLSGLVLGSRWGFVAQFQYLALGAFGAPVFALGRAGFPVLFGPTGGYLLAYPIAALVVGYLVERVSAQTSPPRRLNLHLLASLVGLAILYTYGCTWFWVVSRTTPLIAIVQGALWFLLFDLVKAGLAVGVSKSVR